MIQFRDFDIVGRCILRNLFVKKVFGGKCYRYLLCYQYSMESL